VKPAKLVKDLEKQLKKDPTNPVLRLRLAGALVAAQQVGPALEIYRSVAIGYAEQGRIERAQAVCQSSLEIEPAQADVEALLRKLDAQLAKRVEPATPVAPAAAPAMPRPGKRPSGFGEDLLTPSSVPELRVRGRETGPSQGGSRPDALARVGISPPSATRRGLALPVRPRLTPSGVYGKPGDVVRRRGNSTAPPPMIRSGAPEPPAPPAPHMPPPLRAPSGLSGVEEDDAPTRVADGAMDAMVRLSASPTAPPASPSSPPGRARTARESDIEELIASLDVRGNEGEETVVNDGMSLARVLSPSLVSHGERPELPMFKGLPPAAIAEITTGMTRRRAASGEMIVREGDPSHACYVVVSGELRVLKRDPLNPRSELFEVSRIGEGMFFGEIALLADRRRQATVQAVGEVDYYEIPRALIRKVAAGDPEVDRFLSGFYRERLLASLVATAPFFAPLDVKERAELLRQFQLQRLEPRSPIIIEGNRAGGFYLVVLGSLEITRAVSGERTVLLASLGEGTYFGEMSLLRGDVARASVTATGLTELAMLPAKNLYALVASHPTLWEEVRREARRRELESVQMLAGTTGAL
jgi:CRP-like cAMP-binding protein